ncbi:MAG: peptidoglycan bridge formation glycyltransferase FemA/FemB family protein, partial [Rubrobacteraceae bacterium]
MTSGTRTTEYKVREVEAPSSKEWDSLIQNTPDGGHVFQSHAWGEFKKRLGWTPVRLVMERDGETVGAGQFLLYNTVPVPGKLMYAPKGPWIDWEDEAAVRAFFRDVGSIAADKGAHTVKIEPEVREEQEATKALLRKIGFEKFRWDLNFKT